MKNLILLLLAFFIFTGCAKKAVIHKSSKSQLELRQMQSKKINTTDVKLLSKVILQVLQDDEYIIKNLDTTLGYFNGKKKLDGGKEEYEFAWYDIYYPIAIYKYASLDSLIKEVNVTVSIREYKDHCKIRATFNSDLINPEGHITSSRIIDEPKFYQEFFSKVDKAYFLERNNL